MEAFTKEQLVPDVIDSVPPACLKVNYVDKAFNPGDPMTPTNVKDMPTISYDIEPNVFYSLVFHDPDAPSRVDPKVGEVQHWLVVNIPGNDVSKGKELTQYIGSGAPKGTGIHRYVFLLYKQTSGEMDTSHLPIIDYKTNDGRINHKIRDFASKHALELVAGNFFLAEWDEYVPILHEQLGFKPNPSP